jgi:hypothetical protein
MSAANGRNVSAMCGNSEELARARIGNRQKSQRFKAVARWQDLRRFFHFIRRRFKAIGLSFAGLNLVQPARFYSGAEFSTHHRPKRSFRIPSGLSAEGTRFCPVKTRL